MPTPSPNTTIAAFSLLTLLLRPLTSPTNQIPVLPEWPFDIERTTVTTLPASDTSLPFGGINTWPNISSVANPRGLEKSGEFPRPTTSLERLAGEFRRWRLLPQNWDGEGAAAPDIESLEEAVSFTRLLDEPNIVPDSELHADGRAGLLWIAYNLYADIKFLGDGRLAYYIENGKNQHKGIVDFDSGEIPSVLKAVLPT